MPNNYVRFELSIRAQFIITMGVRRDLWWLKCLAFFFSRVFGKHWSILLSSRSPAPFRFPQSTQSEQWKRCFSSHSKLQREVQCKIASRTNSSGERNMFAVWNQNKEQYEHSVDCYLFSILRKLNWSALFKERSDSIEHTFVTHWKQRKKNAIARRRDRKLETEQNRRRKARAQRLFRRNCIWNKNEIEMRAGRGKGRQRQIQKKNGPDVEREGGGGGGESKKINDFVRAKMKQIKQA